MIGKLENDDINFVQVLSLKYNNNYEKMTLK